MKELMIAVERVVRPVRAEPRRKMKMRQELLAHLTSAYEEGKTRLGNESLALEEAVRRFGKPKELTRDLQASVPVYERLFFAPLPGTKWLTALERKMESKLNEPPSRSVVRWLWLWFLVVGALAVGPAIIIYESRYDAVSAAMALGWLATAAGMFAVSLLGAAAACRALSGSLTVKAVLRASLFAFLTVATPSLVTAAMLHWILDLPIHFGGQIAGVVVGSLLILALSFGVRYQAAAKRSRLEWTSLEISD